MSGLGRGRRESKRLRMLRGKVRFSRRRRHSDRVSSHNFFTANRLDLRMAAELGPAVSKLERLALKGKSYLCYPFCASTSPPPLKIKPLLCIHPDKSSAAKK